MNVAVITVDRPRNYIQKVISQLPKDLRLRVIVGSPSYGYLEQFRSNPRIEIIGVDLAEWDQVKSFGRAHRASWNYWRSLVYGARPGVKKGLLLLEDDVLAAKGWEPRFEKTIEQIETQYGEDYVLALFTNDSQFSEPVSDKKYYTRYPAEKYAGSQAMYYSESVRTGFAEYLAVEGRESFRMGYDLVLREYLKRTGIPLFSTTPCLFEHIGEVGTGLWGTKDKSWFCIKAGNFKKTLPKATRA